MLCLPQVRRWCDQFGGSHGEDVGGVTEDQDMAIWQVSISHVLMPLKANAIIRSHPSIYSLTNS